MLSKGLVIGRKLLRGTADSIVTRHQHHDRDGPSAPQQDLVNAHLQHPEQRLAQGRGALPLP